MNNEATRLAEEAKRLAEDMADRACGSEAGEFVAKERARLHAVIDALATLAQPAVSEDALTEGDMFTLIGHAQVCDSDMRKYFLDLATRLARSRGDAAGAARCAQLAAMASKEKPHD